ncbi:hypothetical protein F9X03_15480 [Salmonella enterica]|nr:hypothetical protein [Salmonella enterica]
MAKYYIYTKSASATSTHPLKVVTEIAIKSFLSKAIFQFQAKVRETVESPSGNLLLVYFGINPCPPYEDSNRLILLDISSRVQLFSISEFGYYNASFSFNEDETLIVCSTKVCDLYINFDGKIVNENDYYIQCIEKGMKINKFIINKFIKIKGNTYENRRKIINAIDLSITNEVYGNPKIVSEFLRIKSDYLEMNGEYSLALNCCLESIKYDSKSPVKNRVKRLLQK